MGGWVGQWVGSRQTIKNRVNRHLIEIIEFCLKIYDLVETLPPLDRCIIIIIIFYSTGLIQFSH